MKGYPLPGTGGGVYDYDDIDESGLDEDGEIETYVNYTAGSSSSYYSNLTI